MMAALAILAAVLREGFRPPALWLALLGTVVVGVVLTAPPLATFATAWQYPAAVSLAAWLLMAATQVDPAVYRRARQLSTSGDPYVVNALARRDALEAQLAEIRSDTLRAEVAAMVQSIDRDLLPELTVRVANFRTLERHLALLKKGRGPLAGASRESVAMLQRAADRQRQALDGLITRLSDMNVNLMGIRQEIDQGQLVERAAAWARDLELYWRTTEDVFRSNERLDERRRPQTP